MITLTEYNLTDQELGGLIYVRANDISSIRQWGQGAIPISEIFLCSGKIFQIAETAQVILDKMRNDSLGVVD